MTPTSPIDFILIIVLFSEYNSNEYTARVTLNDSNGNFIRTVQVLESTEESFYDITTIDTNTIAVSMGSYISIVNIDTQNMLHTTTYGFRVRYVKQFISVTPNM
jgi:hypothetical protein